MLTPRGVSTAHRTRTKFGRAGNLLNVITHGNFKSIEIQLCLWRRVEVSCFSTTEADAINTAKPLDSIAEYRLLYFTTSVEALFLNRLQ